MGVGIEQLGGAGTIVTYEDNASAANGLYYTLTEINAFLVALPSPDWPALGTTPVSYRGTVELQNGDGSGTAVTTLKETNATVISDAFSQLSTSAVGSANRTLQFGEKVVGPNGKPMGKDGCRLVFQGGSFSWFGTVKVYGSHIRCASLSVLPSSLGLSTEIIDTHIDTSGSPQFGNVSGPIEYMARVSIALTGAAGTSVGSFNTLNSEDIQIIGTTQRLLSSSLVLRVRGLTLSGTPTVADARIQSGTNAWDLNEFTPTDAVAQFQSSVANSAYINIWAPYSPYVYDLGTNLPIANMPVTLLDKNGATVVPVSYTDANGLISFGSSDLITEDSVKVKRWRTVSSVGEYEELGPFTARLNMDGTILNGYLGTTFSFIWPRRTSAYGDTLLPLYDGVPMVGGTSWIEHVAT